MHSRCDSNFLKARGAGRNENLNRSDLNATSYELEEHGGHIGYGVRPSERRKGYGKQQLLLVLDAARQMKIPKVMISCDKDNIASGKTAVSCGGILTRESIFDDKEQQIYWIDL